MLSLLMGSLPVKAQLGILLSRISTVNFMFGRVAPVKWAAFLLQLLILFFGLLCASIHINTG